MAKLYTKNTWLDEALATAERYNIKTDGGVAIYSTVQIELSTAIAQAGTDLTAAKMNNIENGIDALDTLLDEVNVQSRRWKQITTFAASPASTSTITMTSDMTASILVGMALRYVIGGVTYYGMVTAITSILLTVAGAPLGGTITSLWYGGGVVKHLQVTVPGAYEDASNNALMTSDSKCPIVWQLQKSYLVKYSIWSRLHDTGTHGQASVRINDTGVNTVTGGLTIAADATWYVTVVDIATAAYDINPGESLEVSAVKGGNGDAQDLVVIMVFVTP